METPAKPTEPEPVHPWLKHAAAGDATLLALLVEQDGLFRQGINGHGLLDDMRGRKERSREVSEDIVRRQLELGIDPMTAGPPLDHYRHL